MSSNKQIILDFLNQYLPIVTLIAFVILIFVFIYFIYENQNKKRNKKESKLLRFIYKNSLLFGFLSTLFAALISLIYSDYLNIAPCGLCWFQRIFLYSQLVLYTVAYIKNDLKVFSYTLWLSIIGGIIALYHEFLQLGFNDAIPCPATAGVVDCAKPIFIQFGFVTFPFMSLVLFLFLILLSFIVFRKNKN